MSLRVSFGETRVIPGSGERVDFGGDSDQRGANSPPELIGSGATLLRNYFENIHYHIENIPSSQMSPIRVEVCKKIRHRTIFQTKVFGKTSMNFDILPENTFSTFTVSLYLILKDKTFSLFTSNRCLEINDTIKGHGSYILDYISCGYLPPMMLDDVRKLNLMWYDGGLLCEIEDQRTKNCKISRTLLRISQSDIAELGPESESEFLLARYPLISFDADVQISRVARAASGDALRWKEESVPVTPKRFVEENYPSIFLKPKEEEKEEKPPEDPEEATNLLLSQLSKLTQK
jgi:hypothetical protein